MPTMQITSKKKPDKPCSRTATLNFEDSTEGHRGGVSMDAKIVTVSPCTGAESFEPEINKSGGIADSTLPPSTRAVLAQLTRRIASSDGSIATT